MIEQLKKAYMMAKWIFGIILAIGFATIFILSVLNREKIDHDHAYLLSKYASQATQADLVAVLNLISDDLPYELYSPRHPIDSRLKVGRIFALDKKETIIATMQKQREIFSLNEHHYCWKEINIKLEPSHEPQRLYVTVFWDWKSECRIHLWSGKYPRALNGIELK